MTDTTPTPPATPTWARWLYPALAITGIATGIFIIAAGLYLLVAQPSFGGSTKDGMTCCAAMKGDMKKMMDDMKKDMPMPSMSPMPPMPSMSPMPMPMPTPSG